MLKRIRLKGISMTPFLRDGDFAWVKEGNYQPGDVLLYKSQAQRELVAHRLIRIQQRNGNRLLIIKPDNGSGIEEVTVASVSGKVVAIERGNKYYHLDNGLKRLIGLFGNKIKPIIVLSSKVITLLQSLPIYPYIGIFLRRNQHAKYQITELDGGYCFKALWNEIPIGWLDIKSEGESCWFIYGLSVRIKFRRIGIAQALCQRAIQMIKEQGGRKIRLLVSTDVSPSRRLYQKLGFRVNRIVLFANEPHYEMVKCLTSPDAPVGVLRFTTP